MRAYFSSRKHFNIYNQVQVRTLTSLFDSFVVPILTYCSEAWGAFLSPNNRNETTFKNNLFNDNQPLEKLHIRFCKQVLGMHNKGSNYGCRNELGRPPLSLSTYCTLLKYWFRLMSLGTNTIAFKALLANNILLHRNKSCWLKTIDSILNLKHRTCADFQYLNEKETIAKVRSILTSIFIKKAQTALHTNKKLTIYKEIKHNYLFEPYLAKVVDFKKRVAVSKMRLSAHNLLIETGRYCNTPRQSCCCGVCNQNEIGDEIQYCMVCPQHEFLHLRTTFLTDLNMINLNFQLLDKKSLFSYIISMTGTSISTITSTYFLNVFKLYNSLLNS